MAKSDGSTSSKSKSSGGSSGTVEPYNAPRRGSSGTVDQYDTSRPWQTSTGEIWAVDEGKGNSASPKELKYAKGGLVKQSPIATIGITRSSRHYPKGK